MLSLVWLVLGAVAFADAGAGDQFFACVKVSGKVRGHTIRLNELPTNCVKKQTVVSWNATGTQGTQGPPGVPGQPGNTGPAGAKGDAGPAGPVGAQGTQGAPGAQGAQGPQGDTGPQGPQGSQGPQGDQAVPGTSPSRVFSHTVGVAQSMTLDLGNGFSVEMLCTVFGRAELWVHHSSGPWFDINASASSGRTRLGPSRMYGALDGQGTTSAPITEMGTAAGDYILAAVNTNAVLYLDRIEMMTARGQPCRFAGVIQAN